MAQNPKFLMTTSMGALSLELDEKAAPLTVENFIGYALDGYYDGTIFHRVIPKFMIQGGGFTPDMAQKPTKAPIKNEASNGLLNLRGSLAMARTSDVDSATSQFFINLVNNPFLDHKRKTADGYGYCVFGWVTSGLEALDAIAKVPTGRSGMHDDVPLSPVVIEKVELA